jgi:hypothetical protein
MNPDATEMNDLPAGEGIIGNNHFAVMAAIHGMHTMPEGKETIHRMELGKRIGLDSLYDSWIPLKDEPLGTQCERVYFTDKELRRRERVKLRNIEIYSQSPLYLARAEKDPTYWDNFDAGSIHGCEED